MLHPARPLTLVALSALAACALAACAPATGSPGWDEQPDDTGEYPTIGGDSRHIQAGPVLATPNDVARGQRLAYHREVVKYHGLSYTLSEDAPSRRELGAITGYVKSGKAFPTAKKKAGKAARSALPPKLDWRGKGVPPIRDQGQCGSCWAFGTTAVVETAMGVLGGVSADMSEQYVLDCNQDGFSCGGGDWSYEMFSPPNGGAPEGEYPYQAWDGACRAGQVSHPYLIDAFERREYPTLDEIKTAIQDHGSVGVSMAVCGSFPGYSGGVYDSTECNGEVSNHIVTLVGWDDTVPHNLGQGVWILRNSWGTSWGENGYAYVAYGLANLEAEMTYVSVNGGAGGGGAGGGGTGGGGTGGGGGGTGGGYVGACAHDPCAMGEALDGTCQPCVALLCLADAYCCESDWDDVCAQEAGLFCGCQ